MVVKSMIIASVLTTISALPVAVPAMTGTPVNVALGMINMDYLISDIHQIFE